MKKIEQYFIYTTIVLLTVVSLLLVIYVLDGLYNWNDAIVGGILGFIGAIIGGVLTLVGVRWTIKEQRYLYFKDRHDNASYIYRELNTVHYSIKSYMIDLNDLNKSELHDKIVDKCMEFDKFIKNNLVVLNATEFRFKVNIENYLKWSNEIAEYITKPKGIGITDTVTKDNLINILNYLKTTYKLTEEYIKNK